MKNKHTSLNIIILITTILFVLILHEIGLWLFWNMSPAVRRPYYQKSESPIIRYELIPNTDALTIKINSSGFRGPEVTVQKPKNTYRILLLGDSEIFSCMLYQKDTLDRQLEEILNSHSKGLKYEVINTGVEGYNTYQELEVLKLKGLKYSPDLVILNFVLNDPEPGEYYFGNNFFSRNSALYRYISYRAKKFLIKRQRKKLGIKTELDHYNYLFSEESYEHLKDTILEMASLLESKNIRLIINIFPTSSIAVKDFKENYPYWHLHNKVKEIKHKNIIYFELIEEFNRLGLTPEDVSVNYKYNESHKNPKALRVIAEFLCRKFKEDNFVKE